MKQVQTPKDLNHVKTRMALGLTKRQLIYFGAAGCVGFPMYLALHKVLPTDISALVMMIVIFPFFFFAMYEKDGKPPEKLLHDIYRQRFLSKGIRRYRSENIYEKLEEQEKIRKEISYLEAKKNKGRTGRAEKTAPKAKAEHKAKIEAKTKAENKENKKEKPVTHKRRGKETAVPKEKRTERRKESPSRDLTADNNL